MQMAIHVKCILLHKHLILHTKFKYMKKILRFFASGLFLVVFLLIIEVVVLLFLTFFMDDVLITIWPTTDENIMVQGIIYFVWFIIRIFGFIAAIVVFFKVLNKHEDPEFKIAWLLGILILPIFVLTMYWIFGNHGLTLKEKRVVEVSRASYIPFLKNEIKEEGLEFVQQLDRGNGAFRYLYNTASMGPHAHNRVTYYKNGEEFFPAMVEELKKTQVIGLVYLMKKMIYIMEKLS